MSDFLGRERELARLRAHVQHAAAGRGAVVLLKGELGIGKTALLRRLSALARDAGAAVGEGRWYESRRMPAYVGFRESLGQLLQNECLRGGLEPGSPYVADLAKLGPEFAAALGLAVDSTERGEDSYRLWRGIEMLLRGGAEETLVVLVLDDLHWADAGSLESIAFLAREIADMRLLIAGAYRDDDVDAEPAIARCSRRSAGLRASISSRCEGCSDPRSRRSPSRSRAKRSRSLRSTGCSSSPAVIPSFSKKWSVIC